MTTTETPVRRSGDTSRGPADGRRQPTTASALPPSYYADPERYKLEEERIFRREWMFACRADQVAKPGDFFTFDVAGTPLVIVRDQQGTLRALSASCLHRYTPIAAGAGNRTSFQCPYHLWTYALDGRLIGAPEMQEAVGFTSSDCRLPEARLEVWEGFVFVNLDPEAEPLERQLATLTGRLCEYRMSEMRTAAVLDYESEWDWKVTMENALESYHNAGVHSQTVEPLFPARTSSHEDVDGPYIYHHLPTRNRVPIPTQFPVPDGLADELRSEVVGVGIHPTLLLVLQPDSMTPLQVIPGSHLRHRVRLWLCFHPSAWDDPAFERKLEDAKTFWDAVQREDMATCQTVQRGSTSSFARPGRLSALEKGVWQFDDWVLSKLGPQ